MQARTGQHVNADRLARVEIPNWRTLAGVALRLRPEGQVLPVLLEQHARQQVWAGKAAQQNMEGGRCLRDRRASAAGEFSSDVLDRTLYAWHQPQPARFERTTSNQQQRAQGAASERGSRSETKFLQALR